MGLLARLGPGRIGVKLRLLDRHAGHLAHGDQRRLTAGEDRPVHLLEELVDARAVEGLRDKVVVILTDGQNEYINEWLSYGRLDNTGQYYSDYSGYTHLEAGRLGTTDVKSAITVMNDRFSRACTAMMARGIIVYTILLGTDAPATAPAFQSCASDPSYYFFAPSSNDLNGIFTQIGNQLRRLRISR